MEDDLAELRRLAPEASPDLLRSVVRRRLKSGTRVFGPGDPCLGLPFVLHGVIRVQMLTAGGHEIVLYRIGDDELCPVSVSCLFTEKPYPAEAVVEEDATALLVPATVFDDLFASSRTFRRFVIGSYGDRLFTMMILLEEIAFRRMDERLAEHLLAHASGGALETTHQRLAVELGTAREVVSRVLKEFERGGILTLERGRIRILDDIALASRRGVATP